uniref:Uncharacterized protein n=1 Tax=Wuchereria bancrofti TaxID=6293 RepID=A0A1I8EBS2_WUCBA
MTNLLETLVLWQYYFDTFRYSLGAFVQSSILQENETFMGTLLVCSPLLVVSYIVIKQGNEQSPKFCEWNEPCKLLFGHSDSMRIF